MAAEITRHGGGPLLSRREALRRSGGAALATAVGGVVLTACGPAASGASGGATASPAVQQPVIELRFQANNQGVSWNNTVIGLDQQYVDETFNAQNPGLRATVDPAGWGNLGTQIGLSIAGKGYDDVVASCCSDFGLFASSGWADPLDSYLQRDNLSANLWSAGHYDALRLEGKQIGLPSYDGPAVMAYRQDILDGLGLDYPADTWDSGQALGLWQQATGKRADGKWRYGMRGLWFGPNHWQVWIKGWGGELMNATQDRLLANSPAVAAGLSFALNLYNNKIENPNGNDVGCLMRGTAVFSLCGGWDVFHLATELGGTVKWDILPVPVWPAGRAVYDNIDFYALNRATAHPEHAWALLKYLTAEPDWQRFQMRTTLIQPCLLSLWDEWETIVKSVVPPLGNKALHWYRDAALGGYGWPSLTFRHSPVQANELIGLWLGRMLSRTVSVQEGLAQMERQVNALQVASSAEQGQAAAISARFPTQGRAIAAVTPGL